MLDKADLLDQRGASRGLLRHPDGGARLGAGPRGAGGAARRIEAAFEDTLAEVELLIPYAEGGRLHELHEIAGDLERTERDDGVLSAPRSPLPSCTARRSRRRLASRVPAVELPVAKLQEEAILPSRAHEGDAGLDLYACESAHLGPGERWSVGTGVAAEIPAGHAGLVLPRSGLAKKHGIALVNALA